MFYNAFIPSENETRLYLRVHAVYGMSMGVVGCVRVSTESMQTLIQQTLVTRQLTHP